MTNHDTVDALPEPFLRSVPGRLATSSGALVLLGIGLLAALGPGPHVLYIVSAIPLACILINIFSVGLGVMAGYEDEPFYVLFSFPFLAGVGLAGLYAAPQAGSVFGAVFALLGAGVLALNARGISRHYEAVTEGPESRPQAPWRAA